MDAEELQRFIRFMIKNTTLNLAIKLCNHSHLPSENTHRLFARLGNENYTFVGIQKQNSEKTTGGIEKEWA